MISRARSPLYPPHRASRWGAALTVLIAGALLSGCLDRKLKALNPCLVSGVVAEIAVTNIDKVDLLFLFDYSQSMAQEQSALREEFPNLINVLATGDPGMGKDKFPPAKDLHLGVVSSDLGLVGISDIDKCSGLGDDGVMQNMPRLPGCKASYPRFLTYNAGINTPADVANDFACVAMLGTDGCGFEQQLEVTLKSLWPSADPRIKFLGDSNMTGLVGHGDNENLGFLRSDPIMGLSLLAIIVVSDEEDCSSMTTEHFTPNAYLDPTNPADAKLLMQGLNVRCNFNEANLYAIDRYVNGFKALRPQNENLIIFAGIVGVPPETVSEQVLANLKLDEEASRNQFYDGILKHALMQPVVNTNNTPAFDDDTMQPSCQTATGLAYPPIRIVKVAQGFGPNGIIQSICQDDFGPAIDAIIEIIAKQLGAVCLPRPLVRNAEGIVGCNVVWELPPVGMAPTGTPTECGAANFPFLLPPEEGEDTESARKGKRCRVAQLAVQGDGPVPTIDELSGTEFADGWYYDDFSEEVKKECKTIPQQRIAFTPASKPPTGVTVKLECLNETQSLAESRPNILEGQPSIGDPCKDVIVNGSLMTDDPACHVRLQGQAMPDTSMFCHDDLNVCVLGCNTDADCPAAWVCDTRADSVMGAGQDRKFCVNPTCGDLK
jgi:hypothetical protein